MDVKERLTNYLDSVSMDYPDAWKEYELNYNYLESDDFWPKCVFVPSRLIEDMVGDNNCASDVDIARLHHLAAWRLKQRIYQVEDWIFDILNQSERANLSLSEEILQKIPVWCLYFDFEGRVPSWQGVFITLDWNFECETIELRLLFDSKDQKLIPIRMWFDSNAPREDAIKAAMEHVLKYLADMPSDIIWYSDKAIALSILPPISIAVNFVEYVCRSQPYLPNQVTYSKPTDSHAKKGPRFFSPGNPDIIRLGEAQSPQVLERPEFVTRTMPVTRTLRKTFERCGHWRDQPIGPRNSAKREYKKTWIPPTTVAPREY